MNTIGELDDEKTFSEQLSDYEVNGYKFSDLDEKQQMFVRGMAFAIDCVDNYFCDADTGYETLDKIATEIQEGVLGEVVTDLISHVGLTMFSMIDGKEE